MFHTLEFPQISGSFFHANWRNAPANVRTLITTRNGGISQAPYHSLNLGTHVGDRAEHVAANRALVQAQIPVPVAYLTQTHSNIVVQASDSLVTPLNADASINNDGHTACAVMTADCLPVLFCNRAGSVVAAAHAGWRGLASGILENTVTQMNVAPLEIMAWLGPAISAEAFEVGEDVREAFCKKMPHAESAFINISADKYLANIYHLARLILNNIGITQISGGEYCTVMQRDTFFSYRRDGETGRMASIIWLEK